MKGKRVPLKRKVGYLFKLSISEHFYRMLRNSTDKLLEQVFETKMVWQYLLKIRSTIADGMLKVHKFKDIILINNY